MTESKHIDEQIARNDERIATLEREIGELKAAIHEIRNDLLGRLPNWATVVIALLSMMVAGLLSAFFT